jgi:hypothetical protein
MQSHFCEIKGDGKGYYQFRVKNKIMNHSYVFTFETTTSWQTGKYSH